MSDEPTIFISHSTGKLPATDVAVQVRQGLVAALKRKGWSVFLDSHSITGGDLWRTEILVSLATSRAGIILLNDNASKSDWVKAEALILCFRKSIDRAFPLLPIVLPGADIGQTFLKSYEPFEFNEIQRSVATFSGAESVAAFVQMVANNPNLEQARQSEPTGATWVQRVADLLGGLDSDVLGRAARRIALEMEPGQITPANHEIICRRLRWALANLMHHKNAGDCLDALSELMAALSEEKVKRLEPHIMSKWVENESAERLLQAMRNPKEQGLLALNTKNQIVADRYAQRLKTEIPPARFISVISLPQPSGDDDEEILMKKVEEAIRKKLTPDPLYDDNGNELPLAEAVTQILQEGNQFAVVMLPTQFSTTTLLKSLRNRFSLITFLALAGDQGERTEACIAAGGRALTPALTTQKLNERTKLSTKWMALVEQYFPNQDPLI
jgi:TIR domain